MTPKLLAQWGIALAIALFCLGAAVFDLGAAVAAVRDLWKGKL